MIKTTALSCFRKFLAHFGKMRFFSLSSLIPVSLFYCWPSEIVCFNFFSAVSIILKWTSLISLILRCIGRWVFYWTSFILEHLCAQTVLGHFMLDFLKITTISDKNMFYILLNDKDKYRLLQFCYDFLDRVNICNIFRNN